MPIIQKILSSSYLYALFTALSGSDKCLKILIKNYIKPSEGEKILDIGCGPAKILNYLEKVEYTGFDISDKYISYAKQKYQDRGNFFCSEINKETIDKKDYYDIVLSIGVIHHLNDNEVNDLFHIAYTSLKKGGRLITFDGCYTYRQSLIKKFLLKMDRGKYIRTEEQYKTLANTHFNIVKTNILNDLLNIPYTINLMECIKE